MFIRRFALDDLLKWRGDVRDNPRPKPLLVRGARQVGKTALIEEFGRRSFQQVITINLEREEHRTLFREVGNTAQLLSRIELKFQKRLVPGQTLIFLDEIQESETAVSQLRYFYEDAPGLHVIGAGSFLEIALRETRLSFPVGRIEYLFLFPLTFDEFLGALGAEISLERIQECAEFGKEIDLPTHEMLMQQFREYVRVGGMPEAVACYAKTRNLDEGLKKIYSSLQLGFENDVFKYASRARAPYLQHVIDQAPRFAGCSVAYEGFAGSHFRSREISAAFATLEGALILHRIFPTSSTRIPWQLKVKRRPKLFYLDAGLVCQKMDAWQALLDDRANLDSLFQGQLAEQIIGQTLLSSRSDRPRELAFWARNEGSSSAEVDFVVQHEDEIIPIEVKSGKSGKLRSLHEFMNRSECALGVCFNNFPQRIEEVRTSKGKNFRILFLPFYLAVHFDKILRRVKNRDRQQS